MGIPARLLELRTTDALAVLIVLGEWTGLARAILGGPYYAALLDSALIGLLILTLVRPRVPRLGRLSLLLAGLIAGYFLLAAIEMLNPNVPNIRVGLEGFRKTAFTMLAFFVLIGSGAVPDLRFYRIFAIGSIPALLFAVRQFFAPTALDFEILYSSGISPITFHSGVVLRAFSPTAGPFHLGVLAACVTVISLALARSGSRWWVAVACLAAATLGLTITRASMIAAIVAVGAMIVISAFGSGRPRAILAAAPAGMAMVLAALIAAGAIGLPALSPGGNSDPGSSFPPSASMPPGSESIGGIVTGVLNPLEDRNLRFRFEFWRSFIIAFAERPLIGYGTSAAADGFDRFYEGTGSRNFEPHSLYLKAALELGILGLLILLAILALALVLSLRVLRLVPVLGLIGIAVLFVFTVSGLTGPMLDAYPLNLLFWSTLGWMALAGSQTSPHPEQTELRPAEAS